MAESGQPLQKPDNLKRGQAAFGIAAAGIGAGVLLGWIAVPQWFNSSDLAGVAMAPDTALLFLLLGVAVASHSRDLAGRPKLVLTVVLLFVAVYGALKYLEYFTRTDLTLEHALLFFTADHAPLRPMLPGTGLLFALAGTALTLEWWARSSAGRNSGGVLGLSVFLVGFATTLGYAYGSPVPYGGDAIPIAMSAAIAFWLLGAGLVAGSGREGLWLRPFMGASVRARMLSAFLPLTEAILILFGFLDVRAARTTSINPVLSLAGLSLIFLTATAAAVIVVSRIISRSIERAQAEQKKAEEELAKFRLAIDRSGDAVFMTDRRGAIVYVNPAFEEMYGYTREEACGRTPRLLKSGLMEPSSYDDFWNALLSKNSVSGDIANKTKGGRFVVVSQSSNPIVDSAGEIVGFLAIHRDVTEQREADAERERLLAQVQEAEQRYRSLFENMLEGYAHCQMIFDAEGRPADFVYLDVNQAFERLTGLKDVVGKKVSQVIPGIREANPELFETYARVTLTGKPEILETHLPSLGIWFSISIYRARQGEFVAIFENITERKTAEETLTRERNLLRTVIENLPDRVFAKDRQGRFILNNRSDAHALGREPEDMVGRTDFDFFPADVAARFRAEDEAVAAGGETIAYETAVAGTDGAPAWIWTKKAPLRGTRGQPLGVVGISRDVSERRELERARASVAAIVESSDDAIYSLTLDRVVTHWNRGAELLYGYAQKEMIGRSALNLVPQDRLGEYDEIMTRISRGERVKNIETVRVRKDGSRIDVSVTISPLMDAEGRIEGASAIARDISGRKQMEQALRLAEEKYRTIVDFAAEGIYQSTPDGRFITANQALADMWGYQSAAELVSNTQNMAEEVYVDHNDRAEFMARIESQGSVRGFESKGRRKDGRVVWISENARAVRDAEGKTLYYEGTVQDITARKQVEEEMRALARFPDESPSPILRISKDGTLLYSNRASGSWLEEWRLEKGGRVPPEIYRHITRAFESTAIQEVELKIGEQSYVAIFTPFVESDYVNVYGHNITGRKEAETRLEFVSLHDALTGLYNRAFFENELKRWEHSRQFPFSIVIADINGLKSINDRLGHSAGDELIRRAARVFRVAFRSEDAVARIGGDEFAVLLPNTDAETVGEVMQRLMSSLAAESDGEPPERLSLAFGAATGSSDESLIDVMKEADRRMYENKTARRGAG